MYCFCLYFLAMNTDNLKPNLFEDLTDVTHVWDTLSRAGLVYVACIIFSFTIS
ncbi:hypothetical protein NTGHW29_160032 [Candidatus Nitrotoga sp. HW29]|nr:hypothetical protein NTGHW29_160032 [Candidatus Nitrotoga sp. HW29]